MRRIIFLKQFLCHFNKHVFFNEPRRRDLSNQSREHLQISLIKYEGFCLLYDIRKRILQSRGKAWEMSTGETKQPKYLSMNRISQKYFWSQLMFRIVSSAVWYIEFIHFSLDRMVALSLTIFLMHVCEWNFCYLIKMSLKIVPKGPVGNNATLV